VLPTLSKVFLPAKSKSLTTGREKIQPAEGKASKSEAKNIKNGAKETVDKSRYL